MSKARNIVRDCMAELYPRKGFHDWWDGVDEDIQGEILLALTERVEAQLSEGDKAATRKERRENE